jgi:hypothetical protein
MRWPWISRQTHDHAILEWKNRANEYRMRNDALDAEASDVRHRLLNRMLADAEVRVPMVPVDPPEVVPMNPTVPKVVDRAIQEKAPAHAKLYRRRLQAWAAQQARDGLSPEAVAGAILDGEADAALQVDMEEV